jgi:hypothetical protein
VSLQQWLKTVELVTVNKAPTIEMIPPGYRAIVNWVKQHIVKEIYARIQKNITLSSNTTAPM